MKQKRNESRFHSQSAPAQPGALARPGARALLSLQHRAEDNQTKVYDIRSESLIAVGIGHSSNVRSLEWSPDERQLVSVGNDCCICVWNFYGTEMANELKK